MKYFYIIKRSGQIYEMNYSPEGYQASISELIKGGILLAVPKGYEQPQAINTKDVTDIVDEQGYEAYISSVKPKEYIKNGVWYDGIQRGEVRLEPWKKAERLGTRALPKAPEKPVDTKRLNKAREKVGEFVRNGFKTV